MNERDGPARRESLRVRGLSSTCVPEIEEFYRDFFLPLVRHAVRRHGLTLEDAGDVVQDAFVLALARLDPARNPKAWLYQVVDHLALNWQRKINRRAQLLARWETAAHCGARIEDKSDEAIP